MQARVPPAPHAQSKGRLAQMVQQLPSVDHAAMHHDDGPGGMPARLVSKQKYFDWQARFLPEDEARSAVALAQRFGVWRMHSEGRCSASGTEQVKGSRSWPDARRQPVWVSVGSLGSQGLPDAF